MGVKKVQLSRPSKSSAGLCYKVRFKFETGKNAKGGYFIVTNRKRKIMGGKQFNNHDSALEFAIELHNKSIK